MPCRQGAGNRWVEGHGRGASGPGLGRLESSGRAATGPSGARCAVTPTGGGGRKPSRRLSEIQGADDRGGQEDESEKRHFSLPMFVGEIAADQVGNVNIGGDVGGVNISRRDFSDAAAWVIFANRVATAYASSKARRAGQGPRQAPVRATLRSRGFAIWRGLPDSGRGRNVPIRCLVQRTGATRRQILAAARAGLVSTTPEARHRTVRSALRHQRPTCG